MKNEKGFTLLEVMVSLLIFAVVFGGMAPVFVAQLRYNTRAEIRAEAAAAASTVLDTLRLQNPTTMPVTGSGAAQTVAINGRDYVVTPQYCADDSFCDSASIRHISVSVTYRGVEVFETETVYTQLQ